MSDYDDYDYDDEYDDDDERSDDELFDTNGEPYQQTVFALYLNLKERGWKI